MSRFVLKCTRMTECAAGHALQLFTLDDDSEGYTCNDCGMTLGSVADRNGFSWSAKARVAFECAGTGTMAAAEAPCDFDICAACGSGEECTEVGNGGAGDDDDTAAAPMEELCCGAGRKCLCLGSEGNASIHKCPGCETAMHATCGEGVGEEGFGQKRLCPGCKENGWAPAPEEEASVTHKISSHPSRAVLRIIKLLCKWS